MFSWTIIATSFTFFLKCSGSRLNAKPGVNSARLCHCFPHRVEFTDLPRDYGVVTSGSFSPHTQIRAQRRGLNGRRWINRLKVKLHRRAVANENRTAPWLVLFIPVEASEQDKTGEHCSVWQRWLYATAKQTFSSPPHSYEMNVTLNWKKLS